MKIPTTIYKTVTGNYHLPTASIGKCTICGEIIDGRVYDFAIVDAVKAAAKPDSIILDCGACYGQMSVEFSPCCRKVYCFEANPDLCEIIRANLELNDCKNVEVINAAVWDHGGELLTLPHLRLKGNDYPMCYGSYFIDNRRSDGHKIYSMAIDSLNLNDVSVMKFDIQGADLRGMQGAQQTIGRCKPTLVFEYETQSTCEPASDFQHYTYFLDSIGYKIRNQIGEWNYVAVPK